MLTVWMGIILFLGINCLVFDLDNTLGLISNIKCPEETRDLLRKLGFNFNLAPVADISTNKSMP